jgi:hypothetical protein
VIALDEVEEIWPRYLSRLREGGDGRKRWSTERVAEVRSHVEALRERTYDTTVVWLALVNGEPVGMEVPAGALLHAGLDYLVSPAGDLMMTSPDASDGLCIELNHTATGDEYEIVGWGSFKPEAGRAFRSGR